LSHREAGLEAYVRVAEPQTTRWERELAARIESAQENPGAFFAWSGEVIRSMLALRGSVIPEGLPLPRDPHDPLFENEAVMAAWKIDYRERQLLRKMRAARRQYLPGQDEVDRQLQELLAQPEPARQ
jgi:tryptophan 2,3-dioxygenase